MTASGSPVRKLEMMPLASYVGVDRNDPIRFYRWPIVGPLYRRRVELCLGQLRGGERVLEVGFGSGVSFLTLSRFYQQIHGIDLTADVGDVQALFAARGVPTRLIKGSVLALPYADETFDAVLLISILEHLQAAEQPQAFSEIRRVLKPGAQVVYGVPVERPLMTVAFRLLGHDIRRHHFSTHEEVARAAQERLRETSAVRMEGPFGSGIIYEVRNFTRF